MSGKERNGKWALCVRVTRLLLTCWEKKEISREDRLLVTIESRNQQDEETNKIVALSLPSRSKNCTGCSENRSRSKERIKESDANPRMLTNLP